MALPSPHTMIYALYNLFFNLILSIVAPTLLARRKIAKSSLAERSGKIPKAKQSSEKPIFWIHACSVGETLSVQPLVAALHERFPDVELRFSTVTETGQAIAKERFARYGTDNTFYAPVDTIPAVRSAFKRLKPKMLIIVDTEIWPNWMREAHAQNVPVVLVNGRISPKSFRMYRWGQAILGQVFSHYRLLLMASELDAERIQQMGASPSKIRVSGNLKYDIASGNTKTGEAGQRLDASFGLSQLDASLIVAGSTHDGEEIVVLDAFSKVRQTPGLEQTRLLLAPRHPERAEEVASLIAERGFTVHRRSSETPAPSETDVYLLDTVGELAAAYAFATVVFVGGTLVPKGGHSILEPAGVEKPIIVGPHMENFPGIIDVFLEEDALRQVHATETNTNAQVTQLAAALSGLLIDPISANTMAAGALDIMKRNQGATKFTIDCIAEIYEAGK